MTNYLPNLPGTVKRRAGFKFVLGVDGAIERIEPVLRGKWAFIRVYLKGGTTRLIHTNGGPVVIAHRHGEPCEDARFAKYKPTWPLERQAAKESLFRPGPDD